MAEVVLHVDNHDRRGVEVKAHVAGTARHRDRAADAAGVGEIDAVG
jgi:hypothetical protein